ncbi:hypothetical protein ACFFQW_28150 [Umezawaea endophytica]|uniref:Uncharacterized protein n=1 Tax=Umezawaea endophytica TaxID=1654476 RepID=A0A9X2VQB7_9PSEU|nr:hypothetical protein [Umezawaea endophytica]MCS7480876.1 hypothetical protein [Umezawaea endophytica]
MNLHAFVDESRRNDRSWGGEWRRRAMPLVAREVNLDTWSG